MIVVCVLVSIVVMDKLKQISRGASGLRLISDDCQLVGELATNGAADVTQLH